MSSFFLNSPSVRYTEAYEPTHTYTFTGKCITCGKDVSVTVDGPALYKYRQGEYIQRAFPKLDANMREWMMSGICGACFDRLPE